MADGCKWRPIWFDSPLWYHICPVVSIANAELMGHEIKCQ
jgi:hypothetical protein